MTVTVFSQYNKTRWL